MKQIRAYGRFCSQNADKRDEIDSEMVERVAFARSYFKILEEAGGLSFDTGETPLLYNTVDWDQNCPVSGYPDSSHSVKPSQMINSYVGTWTFQWQSNQKSKSSARRPLKAALWLCHDKGVIPAIDYLFDIFKHGLILFPGEIYKCLVLLLDAYRATGSDDEIAVCFFDEIPSTHEEWLNAEFSSIREIGAGVKKRAVKREDLTEILYYLVEFALNEIEVMRKSHNYDEWITALWLINHTIEIVQQVIQEYIKEKSVSLKAVDDQLDEIRADSGGFISVVTHSSSPNKLAFFQESAEVVIIMLKAASPDDWKMRVMNERAVVPNELEEYFLEERFLAGKPLPEGWRMISAELAPIFTNAVLKESEFTIWRSEPYTADEILSNDIAGRILDRHEIFGLPERNAIAKRASEAKRRLNLFGPEDPMENWLDANDKTITPIIEEINLQMSSKVLLQTLEHAAELKQKSGLPAAIELLKGFLEKFPGSDFALYELGIAYDESGDHEAALKCIETAILIRPFEEYRWNSLAIVLKKLEEWKGSMLASFLSRTIGAQLGEDKGPIPTPY